MPQVRFTERLQDEYARLYVSCEIRPSHFREVDAIADAVVASAPRYEAVGASLGIPWHFVAAVHNLEASRRFDRHLHNGDPLTARTRLIPSNRPATGTPPFTWEESAVDALRLRRLDEVDDWTLPRLLYEAEGYNGWGYRNYHPHVPSPYLWGCSNHYDTGKYIADGTWSETARSKQCGVATLVRRLAERGAIEEPLRGTQKVPLFRYRKTTAQDGGEDVQRFLNTLPGVALRVDGVLGPKSSDAMYLAFGCHLRGDPRQREDPE